MRKLLLILMVVWSPAVARGQTVDPELLLARQLTADQGLFFSLARGDVQNMTTLITQKADPNASLGLLGLKAQDVFGDASHILNQPFDLAGLPILHWAVFLDNIEAVKVLLRGGALVNAADIYGATALHWAAWGGRHSIGKLLLNNGASCRSTDIKRRTPKDWAVMSSQSDMLILLESRACRPGAIKDSDGDGVPDNSDLCRDTPKGAAVDERGCWVVAYANFFDFDKAIVKDQYLPHLVNAAQVFKNNPGLKVNIQGHADHTGTDEYNLRLGLRRAEAVKRVLVDNGVNPDFLLISSMGKRQPVADNRTARGRALNRRVEIHVREPGIPDGAGVTWPGSAVRAASVASEQPAAKAPAAAPSAPAARTSAVRPGTPAPAAPPVTPLADPPVAPPLPTSNHTQGTAPVVR